MTKVTPLISMMSRLSFLAMLMFDRKFILLLLGMQSQPQWQDQAEARRWSSELPWRYPG